MSTILVVDDDLDTAQVTSFYLQHKGQYRVLLATSGDEALKLIAEEPPTLVLTDVNMLPMDGYELCRRIKANPATQLIPVVFVTAQSDLSDVVTGLDLGGDDYIAKPFEMPELLARVRVMLRMRALREQLVEQERLRALVELAGTAAHEINQPLTVLQGSAELLRMQCPDLPQVQERCERVLSAAKRIADLVRQMGEVRRYRTRPYVGDRSIIDLSEATRPSD